MSVWRPTLAGSNALALAGSGRPGEIWCNWIVRRVTGEPDLAWLIGVAYQGHNFATEAALAMTAWLVRHGVDENRLSAHIHPEHRASQVVAGRIGLHASDRIDDDGEVVWTSSP